MTYDHEKFMASLEPRSMSMSSREVHVVDCKNDYVARWTAEPDFEQDISAYGTVNNERSEWMVDRKYGVLLGEWVQDIWEVPAKPYEGPESTWGKTHNYDQAQRDLEAYAKAQGIFFVPDTDDFHSYTADYDEDRDMMVADISGYKIMKDGLYVNPRFSSRDHYRYWHWDMYDKPGDNNNWAHVTGEELEKVIKEHGSILGADISYMVQDFERLEHYYADWWTMMLMQITWYYRGVKIGDDYWSYESDIKGDPFQEFVGNGIGDLDSHLLHMHQEHIEELARQMDLLNGGK